MFSTRKCHVWHSEVAYLDVRKQYFGLSQWASQTCRLAHYSAKKPERDYFVTTLTFGRGTICNALFLCIFLIFNKLRQYLVSFFPHIFPTKCNFIAGCWMKKVVLQSLDSNFCHFCKAIKAFPNLPLMAGLFSICHPYQQRFYR